MCRRIRAQVISFRKVLGKFPMPLTGFICIIIYLYIKCKYKVSVLQVYFLPSTIALFFIYLQNVTSMFFCGSPSWLPRWRSAKIVSICTAFQSVTDHAALTV